MKKPANKLESFINKSFTVKPNTNYKAGDHIKLLLQASSHNTYLETVKSENLPDPDTLHERIKQDTSFNQLRESFLQQVESEIKDREVILILGYTHLSFYGKTSNSWIHRYKPDKGTRGSFKFLTASIVSKNKRYFVDSKIMSLFSNKLKEIKRIIKQVRSIGLKIEVCLADRGIIRDSFTIELFESQGVKYLGLYPKYKNVKRILNLMNSNTLKQEFKVKGVKTNLVVIKDKWDWTFVTNLQLRKGAKYIRLYRKRWNIETGFRVKNEARIKTKSVNPLVRYFLFLTSLLLYNEWKSIGVEIQFKRFEKRSFSNLKTNVFKIFT